MNNLLKKEIAMLNLKTLFKVIVTILDTFAVTMSAVLENYGMMIIDLICFGICLFIYIKDSFMKNELVIRQKAKMEELELNLSQLKKESEEDNHDA